MVPELRTLFITGHRVHPALGGAALRNWQNINMASRFGQVATFTVLEQTQPDRLNTPEVLAQATEYIVDREVTGGSTEWLHRKTWPLRPRALPRADRMFQSAGMAALSEMLARFQPTLVVLEELWLWRYLEGVSLLSNEDPKIVYDAHNVESIVRRSILMSNGRDRSDDRAWRQSLRKRLFLRVLEAVERHVVTNVDQVWACSQHDADQLISMHGEFSGVAVIPNGVDTAEYDSLPPLEHPSDQEFNVLFVGSFGYTPNARAAEYLIHDVFPCVWSSRPDCRLMIVGRDPTVPMRNLASKDSRVLVTGAVPDVRPYLAKADAVVAPIHEGSGTRIKILEAFAARRPVVATSKGVEGLAVHDGVHALIRDTPTEFANAIVDLVESEDHGLDLAARAYDLVTSRYSWTKITYDFTEALETLFYELPPGTEK